jgi:cytoskeletal protein CcmA (bactofilin family)
MSEDQDDHPSIEAPPLKPFSRKGTHTPPSKPSGSFRAEIPRRVVEIPGTPRRNGGVDDDANKLTVGRNIKLHGEITSCEKLVVEGRVEASISDARVIEIAPSGYFKGNADVREADISGHFEGSLTAHEKLVIRKGGRVTGSVRYGRIVIESGGEISGDMASLEHTPASGPGHAAAGFDRD